MTDGLDQALAGVALALLAADAGLTVLDGVVPDNSARPYVLVYTSLSRPSDDPDNAADGQTRVWVSRWICHCVGDTAAASRAVAQRVRTALLDVQPTVPGLSCGLIRMEGDSLPPDRDESTGVAVMDAVVTYRLRANS
jgi:hypothetical protein